MPPGVARALVSVTVAGLVVPTLGLGRLALTPRQADLVVGLVLGLLAAAWVGVWARYVRPEVRAAAARRAKLAADRAAVVSGFSVPEGEDATPARKVAERRAWWAREGDGSRVRFEALARAVSHALDRGEDSPEWLDAEGRADVARWRDAGGLPQAGEVLRWLGVVHGPEGDHFEVALGRRALAFRRTGGAAFTCWRVRASE